MLQEVQLVSPQTCFNVSKINSSSTTGGEDFSPFIESLEFGVGLELEQCRVIQTFLDQALESIQDFRVTAVFDGSTNGIDGSPQTVAIDNVPDGKCH